MTAYGFDLNKTLVTIPTYLDYVASVDQEICQRWLKAQEDHKISDQAAINRFEEIIEYGLISGKMKVAPTRNAVETIRTLQDQGHRIFAYSTCTARATEAALENTGFPGIEPLSTFDYQDGQTDAKTVEGLQAVQRHLGMPIIGYADDKLSDLRSARTAFGNDAKLYHVGGTANDKETGTIAIATLDQILQVEESKR